MIRRLLLWASTNRFLAKRLPRLGFVRKAVRRFIPGETLEEAVEASERMGEEGIAAVLTLLGENVESAEEAREVRKHYADALTEVEVLKPPAAISVKLTQLGLDQDPGLAREAVEDLCRGASPTGRRVWIDMEASAYVDRTLELYRAVRRRHDNAAVCLQAYLYRTPDDLEELLEGGATIRLVKGAYAEPPDVAFPDRADVDEAYLRLASTLLDDLEEEPSRRHAFATHDLELLGRIRAEARERGLPDDAYELQMLYGIRPGAQRRLARDGASVRVLISYGPAWFPWYMRRLAERPANLWFLVRSLFAR